MSGAAIVIIAGGGGGPRLNTEYGTSYPVSAGDTAENTSGGAVELHFVGDKSGASIINVSGYSGYQFAESGTFATYQ